MLAELQAQLPPSLPGQFVGLKSFRYFADRRGSFEDAVNSAMGPFSAPF